jgi:hypothetical protein
MTKQRAEAAKNEHETSQKDRKRHRQSDNYRRRMTVAEN